MEGREVPGTGADAGGDADDAAAERAARAQLVHDLRTPLTVVAGFADMLERRGDELSEGQRADLVRRIADGAREMRALLDADRSTRSAE